MTSREMTGLRILGEMHMPAVASEVGGMRRRSYDTLVPAYEAIADDVVLLACELATNAVRHSGSTTVTITLVVLADAIRVEVADDGSSGRVPRIADAGPDATGGRGLRMVDILTGGRWGTYTSDAGRVVWCETAFPEPRTVREEPTA
ncbi:ATP-binding protein [Actinoallomurus purpureus]|uniref:ATP-binding protein n=1 Tax=Actinoallomurus purpureus TaxID=478114 RepID=UPI002092BAE6|nr:ATP-binding protein [Actinoallomurus purpureus]MCO6005156.1 ATP-binding protein [Actinoallomurus purpureus]